MWGVWLERGVRLLPLIVGAVHAVERCITATDSGGKQDAAVDAVRAMFAAVEIGAQQDLLDDREVDAAVRGVITAYVHLQNIVARKATAAPAP